MTYIDADGLADLLPPGTLVESLRTMFRQGAEAPLRQHYSLPHARGEGVMLLMPAWVTDGFAGVKIVTVHPNNIERGLPTIFGSYILMDQGTGQPLAFLDGRALTLHRTAAASVLAATYLARKDSSTLLMVGTGQLAPYVVKAYAALFPITSVWIWGRTPVKADALADRLSEQGIRASTVTDLSESTPEADIVSCATLSQEPLIRGDWLRPGTHLDLIGGFTPAMREADDEAVRRASLFVDTREGALREAGDLIQPIENGVIREADIAADLFDLTRGHHPGRTAETEITLFKSVGTALEDLAAAGLAYRRHQELEAAHRHDA